MADTRREKAALQTLHGDNTSGDISAQDNRDGWETCHPANIIQTAAFASEPAAGQITGDLFFPNNGFFVERYSGSAWAPWGPVFPFTKPVDGDFAWVNQGGATVTTTNGGIALYTSADTGFLLRLRVKTAPATPYTITTYILPALGPANFSIVGMCFRQSSDGKLATWGLINSSGAKLQSAKFTSATAFSATYSEIAQPPLIPRWWRIADNGTSRICSFSADGVNFITFHTVGRTDFMTADQVGFFVQANTYDACATLLHWKEA